VVIVDVCYDPVWNDLPLWLGEQRIESALLLPIRLDGMLQAVIVVGAFIQDAYGPAEIELAEAFAELLTRALRNAARYGRPEAEAPRAHEAASGTDEPEPDARVAPRARQIAAEVTLRREPAALFEDLRLLAQIERGALMAEPEPVELRQLVERSIAETHRDEATPPIGIDLEGGERISVHTDLALAVRALGGVIENAVRHSPNGGRVRVSWRIEGRTAAIRVRDQGAGIATDDQDLLFHRFGQIPTQPLGGDGFGLGLYLGRAVAQAMGGELELEESGPAGSVFRMILPLIPD